MRNELTPHAAPAEQRSISAHLAFLYALALPGLGEFYAGGRLRGAASLAAVLALTAWTTILCKRAFEFVLYGKDAHFGPVDLLALYGLYAVWLWAMFSSVQCATARRRNDGDPPQSSPVWACFFSWLSPGAAQAYLGKTRLGLLLFLAFLTGAGLEIPMYRLAIEAIEPLIKVASASNPLALITLLNEVMIRIKLNLATNLKELAVYGSVFLAMFDLQGPWRSAFTADRTPDFTFSEAAASSPAPAQRRPPKRPPFARSTEGRALGLAFLGWICPGSAQLLLGRTRLAWVTLAAYAGGNTLIAALLAADAVAPLTADGLTWGPSLVRLAAIVHAVIILVGKPASIPPA